MAHIHRTDLQLAGSLLIPTYLLLVYWRGSIGWQHAGLAAVFWACLSTREGSRRFITDWWPILLFWVAYDSMRLYPGLFFFRVEIEQPYLWESRWFVSPDGDVWPFYFTRWLQRYGDALWPRLLRAGGSVVYLSHIFAVPLVFLILWFRGSNLLFHRLLWPFTALHVLGLVSYFAYPAAPPWWVYENGFFPPSAGHSMPGGAGTGPVLAEIFKYSANRFAAVPSLHGAYPVLLTLVLALHGTRWRWIVLSGIYAASMWLACVLLNQHYIVDLLLGAGLAFLCLPFAAFGVSSACAGASNPRLPE